MPFASVPCPELNGSPCTALSCVNDMTCAIRNAEYPDAVIDAAAGVLYRTGLQYGWFPEGSPSYEELDSIAKSEFDGIVEQMLRAAKKARETL